MQCNLDQRETSLWRHPVVSISIHGPCSYFPQSMAIVAEYGVNTKSLFH